MENNSVRVSIITACYNSREVIEEAILSVLDQSYDNIEYIIVDGGSTDGTVDVIRKYSDRISFWVSEPDRGICDAWNKALNRCSGAVVGILNADDTYTPDAVKMAAEALDANPGAGFIFGDVLLCDPEGKPCFCFKGSPDYEQQIVKEMVVPHPSVFVREVVYKNCGGFDLSYKTAMDYEFIRRITSKGFRGVYLPKVFVKMRLGGESDNNFYRGYREVMEASVKYGYPKPLALARYNYKVMKTNTRRALQRLGLNQLVKLIRQFGRRYEY